MIKHIVILPLICGIIIGILGVFYIKPEQKIIYKYPNPEDTNKTIYKDKNGVCYTYSSKETNCDKNEEKLKNFPLSK
jgi:hypothetical protein